MLVFENLLYLRISWQEGGWGVWETLFLEMAEYYFVPFLFSEERRENGKWMENLPLPEQVPKHTVRQYVQQPVPSPTFMPHHRTSLPQQLK